MTGIYAGLKLTGFALRVATDMATSLSKEANSAFAVNEELQAAKASLHLYARMSPRAIPGIVNPSEVNRLGRDLAVSNVLLGFGKPAGPKSAKAR